MKKLWKMFALLLAMSLISWGGLFTSCSSDSDDDDEPSVTPTEKTDDKSDPSSEKDTVTSIEVEYAAEKTWHVGDTISASDVKVTAVFKSGTKQVVSEGITVEPSTLTADTKTITVKYSGFTKTLDISVVESGSDEQVFAQTMTLDFTGDATGASAWNGVPKPETQGSSLVTRSENSYTGYLGRKFWLVNGVYAEYRSGLGYTHSENDATLESADFVKAIESEAITGPFELSVTENTNNAGRLLKIYISTSKENLWDDANVVLSEGLEKKTHTVSYDGSDGVYIGIGTLPAENKTVYTSLQNIVLKSNTAIPEDTFPVTSLAFTNSGVADGALVITKDAVGTDGYQLTTEVLPAYASDKTVSYSVTGNSKVSVSESGLVTIASDMSENETVTITAKANNGDVSANLNLTVKAVAGDSDQVAQTKNELATALGSFSYGDTASVVANANTLISATTFTYADVQIVPSVEATTGLLTFTITKGEATDTVTFEYTEEIAKSAVSKAVEAIAALSAYKWATNADATKSALDSAISASNLADVDVSTVTGKTEDGQATVTVTVTNKIITSVTDSTLVLESPRYTVADGVLTLSAKSYEYYLSFDSVTSTTGDDAWSSTTSTVSKTGRSGAEAFKTSFTGFDLKSSATITLKFTNVYSLSLWIKGSLDGRTFSINGKTFELNTSDKVTAGNLAPDYTTGDNSRFDIEDIDPTSVMTLVITGGKSSIYPLGIILYSPSGDPITIGNTSSIPSDTNDVTLVSNDDNTLTASADGISSFTWYVDNEKQTSTSATLDLSSAKVGGASLTIGNWYEVRVEALIGGNTYSDSITVQYK
ncbi:MAG: bacterial Ig-like domain-containing protein [Treponema sp.]|nr:bacterial Ig-like domain-containing protein [Treponema sp.]